VDSCCDTFCEDVAACLSPGMLGIITDDSLTGDGTTDNPLSVAAGAGGGSMFYGLTAGTGNGGTDDYPSTVPVKTAAATGRVPFPRTGPSTGGIILGPANPSSTPANNFDNVILVEIGTYEVTFNVHTTEQGQLQLEVNGVDIPESVVVDANPTSGGHLLVGTTIITTSAPNSVLAVINSVGNATALTITQSDGNLTAANAQRLIVKKIG